MLLHVEEQRDQMENSADLQISQELCDLRKIIFKKML